MKKYSSIKFFWFILPVIVILNISCNGSDPDMSDKINDLIQAYTNQDLFNGVILVAGSDKILYHRAFGVADRSWNIPVTTDTKFKIGSISKPITATLILKLADLGFLSLDQTISDYLPDYRNKQAREITIHQLLTHTSGILNSLPAEQEAIQERLPHTLSDLAAYCANADLYFDPGSGFHYSNYGYSLLALIAERATGRSFNELLDVYIFNPLRMMATKSNINSQIEHNLATGYEYDLLRGYEETSYFDNSYALGYGSVSSTTEDLYTWIRALQSNRLLKEETREKMDTPTEYGPYGYGWFIRNETLGNPEQTVRIIEHSGSINGFGCYLAHIPDDSLVIIVLKNSRAHNYIRPGYSSSIGKQIISLLYGEEIEVPKKSIAIHLARIIGEQGIEQAKEEYYLIKNTNTGEFNMDESELNKLGIELHFGHNRTQEALKIFEINMIEFPDSYNTYDSYAFILNEMGDVDNAIHYYKQGLKIMNKYPDKNNSPDIQKNAQNARQYLRENEKTQIKIPFRNN